MVNPGAIEDAMRDTEEAQPSKRRRYCVAVNRQLDAALARADDDDVLDPRHG